METTLLMPFLLFTCAGVFEFGNLFYQKLLIEAGVRDAARYVARCTWPSPTTCVETGEEIAVYGEPDGSDPRVDGFTTGDVDIDPTFLETANTADEDGNYPYRGGPFIYTVRATASVDYDDLGLFTLVGVGPITLNAMHEERYIGW